VNSHPVGELQVDSDLQLVVDGVPARIVSDGHRVTLTTEDAGRLLAQALVSVPNVAFRVGGPLRGAVAELGATLNDVGLTAAMVETRGIVAELGRDCSSPVGRLLFGSEHVRLGRVSLYAVGTVLRSSAVLRRRLGVAAGIGAVSGLVVTAGLRRGAAGRGGS
jgi:hypothetical protein